MSNMKLKMLSYEEVISFLDCERKPIKQFDIHWLNVEPFKNISFKFSKEIPISWDTNNFWLKTSATIADICHETAHWIISRNRNLNDFGLGTGFSSTIRTERIFPEDLCDLEELVACYIEWCLMRHFGCSNEEISWIIRHESMHDFNMYDYVNIVIELNDRLDLFKEANIELELP